MRFKIVIELGNEAMQSAQDVAAAIEGVAERLKLLPSTVLLEEMDEFDSKMEIRDTNGNRVGFARVAS